MAADPTPSMDSRSASHHCASTSSCTSSSSSSSWPATSEVYVLGRPFSEWGGGIFQNLPPPVREAVLNLGLCHYLVVIKQPCGTVVQFDFGPKGGRDVSLGSSSERGGLPAEVREAVLHAGMPEGPPALFVGTTTMCLDHIREFNSEHPQIYSLYESDCRHYVNGLVKYLTGTERSTATYLRHRYLECMVNDREWIWHKGLYDFAQAIADVENWTNDESAERGVVDHGLASAYSAALAVSESALAAAKRELAKGLGAAVPRSAGQTLRAASSRLARAAASLRKLHNARAASSHQAMVPQLLVLSDSHGSSGGGHATSGLGFGHQSHDQNHINPDEWLPFSDDEYDNFATSEQPGGLQIGYVDYDLPFSWGGEPIGMPFYSGTTPSAESVHGASCYSDTFMGGAGLGPNLYLGHDSVSPRSPSRSPRGSVRSRCHTCPSAPSTPASGTTSLRIRSSPMRHLGLTVSCQGFSMRAFGARTAWR